MRLGLVSRLGRYGLRSLLTARGILAFALITLGAALTRGGKAGRVVRPLIRDELYRAGWRLLPMTAFVAAGLGLLLLGQAMQLLLRVGAEEYLGAVIVTAVVREIGPLVVAVLVLTRAGTAHVIELGTSRALGELEALEALAIDPVRYLVVPRVIGMALSVLALTVYFLLITLAAGFAFAFLENLAITPAEYTRQLALALRWGDFLVLGLKTTGFGALLGAITCYHGLARPLRLEELPAVTSRAVLQGLGACLVLDLFLLVVQWLI